MLKEAVKKVLGRVAPEWFATVQAVRGRRLSHRLFREWGLAELSRKLVAEHGPVVRSGPFAGMVLTPATLAEHIGPFLLGTYEAELHPALTRITARPPALIVDVGAKFGYYAVGLARLFPGTPVHAYDTDPWARRATREMAAGNGTPGVRTFGFCTPETLSRTLVAGSFVFSDCEGYEAVLFPHLRTPAADASTFLIEVHEPAAPGVSAALRERFRATHRCEVIRPDGAAHGSVFADALSPEDREAATREVRGEQEWHVYEPGT